MLSTGVSRSRLDLQERLLDKPIFVRLKFLGLGVPGGQPVPAKYTVRDVQVGALEDIARKVDEWLGSPGSWRLATAANWPLTSEAIRLPTTKRSPLVVNVRNSEEFLLARLEDMDKKHVDLEKKFDLVKGVAVDDVRRLTKEVKSLQECGPGKDSAHRGDSSPRRRCGRCLRLVGWCRLYGDWLSVVLALCSINCFFWWRTGRLSSDMDHDRSVVEDHFAQFSQDFDRRAKEMHEQIQRSTDRLFGFSLKMLDYKDNLSRVETKTVRMEGHLNRLNDTMASHKEEIRAQILLLNKTLDEEQRRVSKDQADLEKRVNDKEAADLQKFNISVIDEEEVVRRVIEKKGHRARLAIDKVQELEERVNNTLHHAEDAVANATKNWEEMHVREERMHISQMYRGLRDLRANLSDLQARLGDVQDEVRSVAALEDNTTADLRADEQKLDTVARLDDQVAQLARDVGHISRLQERLRRKYNVKNATIRDDEQTLAKAVHREKRVAQKVAELNRTFDIDQANLLDKVEQEVANDRADTNDKFDELRTDDKVEVQKVDDEIQRADDEAANIQHDLDSKVDHLKDDYTHDIARAVGAAVSDARRDFEGNFTELNQSVDDRLKREEADEWDAKQDLKDNLDTKLDVFNRTFLHKLDAIATEASHERHQMASNMEALNQSRKAIDRKLDTFNTSFEREMRDTLAADKSDERHDFEGKLAAFNKSFDRNVMDEIAARASDERRDTDGRLEALNRSLSLEVKDEIAAEAHNEKHDRTFELRAFNRSLQREVKNTMAAEASEERADMQLKLDALSKSFHRKVTDAVNTEASDERHDLDGRLKALNSSFDRSVEDSIAVQASDERHRMDGKLNALSKRFDRKVDDAIAVEASDRSHDLQASLDAFNNSFSRKMRDAIAAEASDEERDTKAMLDAFNRSVEREMRHAIAANPSDAGPKVERKVSGLSRDVGRERVDPIFAAAEAQPQESSRGDMHTPAGASRGRRSLDASHGSAPGEALDGSRSQASVAQRPGPDEPSATRRLRGQPTADTEASEQNDSPTLVAM